MVENVTQLQFQISEVRGVFLLREQICEDMVEDIAAQALLQSILGFKMGVESARPILAVSIISCTVMELYGFCSNRICRALKMAALVFF